MLNLFVVNKKSHLSLFAFIWLCLDHLKEYVFYFLLNVVLLENLSRNSDTEKEKTVTHMRSIGKLFWKIFPNSQKKTWDWVLFSKVVGMACGFKEYKYFFRQSIAFFVFYCLVNQNFYSVQFRFEEHSSGYQSFYMSVINPLNATKWSNALKQFVRNSRRIVWPRPFCGVDA